MGQSQSVASKDFKPRSYLRTGLKANIPLAVVEEILLNLPGPQVVLVCRLVCHEWKELVDSAAHWKERCRREGIKPLDASRPPDDWCSFYILTKKQRNLIKNPKAEAVVEEILLNLPASQVVLVCRLVCHEWKELVDSAAHWKERCRREGIKPLDASRPPDDWCSFYILSKKQRNLIKNPKGEDKLQGWKIVQNGGDGWVAEENRKPFPDETVTKCFVTSYGLCLKQQLIDLRKEGYIDAFMDQLQPHIKITDWYAPRFDCGCQYEITVELLNQRKKPMCIFQPEKVLFEQWNDEPWCQVTHVFKDYGPGLRFIRFTHGGVDTQFWAGWFGIRVTNSTVEICPANQKECQPYVPLLVVEEILLNLPAHQVVGVCSLVCHKWKELVDSAAHWEERCRREGIKPLDASRPPDDWRSFYILTKTRRNLIKNPKAEDGFNGWNVVHSGGDGWAVEDNHTEIPNCTVSKYFVTSFQFCLKEQLIDLKKEGYNAAFMDQLQPHIRISDWYSSHRDGESVYHIYVKLLDQKMEPINEFELEPVSFPQGNDQQWHEMTHVFKDYGPGVRFIRFTHGGQDTVHWGGWYGIRVTNSTVEICPAK